MPMEGKMAYEDDQSPVGTDLGDINDYQYTDADVDETLTESDLLAILGMTRSPKVPAAGQFEPGAMDPTAPMLNPVLPPPAPGLVPAPAAPGAPTMPPQLPLEEEEDEEDLGSALMGGL